MTVTNSPARGSGHPPPRGPNDGADLDEGAFSRAMVISGVRCILSYVVFPLLLPAAGWAGGVGPLIGAAIGVIAIAFNGYSVARFGRSRHRYRWLIISINLAVIVLLLALLVDDIGDLLN